MTTPTQAQIVQQMRDGLAITLPDLDTTIGTPVRKMLDVVGEVGAEGYADRYLLEYQYDIEAKQGTDLDDFVALFGQQRLVARRASGTVTFERLVAATVPILIPMSTQLATTTNPVVIVQTVVPAVLPIGETAISIPVQAVIGGAAGNVGPNTVTRRVSTIEASITSFSNISALSGGVDAESDAALRARFRRTVFKNMAGTDQMFLGVALDDPDVSQANILGASKRWREQVHVISGTATSTVPNAKYIYPNSSFVGVNIDGGSLLTVGIDYSFNAGALPPTITSLSGVTMPDGIYDLEFEYLPNASRNDPTTGITNRIDVYVNGVRATDASQTATFKTANVFNNTGGSYLKRSNYERVDGSLPVAGNYFIPLVFSPVTDISVSNQLVINGVTYTEGTHYYLVNDITADGMAPSSYSGIEFRSAGNGNVLAIPANNQQFVVDYIFNAIPRDLEIAFRSWRLVTTDVKVHAAQPIFLNVYLVVILNSGYTSSAVLQELQSKLGDLIAGIGFARTVQVSDLLSMAHQVPGVDAVRFATSADDAVNFGIQHVAADGTTILGSYDDGGTPKRAKDVAVDDDSVPVLNLVSIVVRAQNSFGIV
jgi:hypothetical protein